MKFVFVVLEVPLLVTHGYLMKGKHNHVKEL